MAKDIDKKIYKTGYRSEIDKFFHEFDEKRTTLPPSRIQEVKKHQAIFHKRDCPVEPEKPMDWAEF